MRDKIVLVNRQDEVIGEAEKLKAHQDGLLHRAFSVFIYRLNQETKLEILLQQRQIRKYHSGGLWTNTCCSHPGPGEEIQSGAQRRLFEEMGLTIPLTFLGKFYYQAVFENGMSEHEWDYVFAGEWKGETISFDPEEVQDYRWATLDDILQDLIKNPEIYTCWFEEALNFLVKKKDVILFNLSKG